MSYLQLPDKGGFCLSRNQNDDISLDELDIKLIQYLQKDGRIPYTELADILETTSGTVRNRVQRLKDHQLLKVVGVVNPFKTGLPTVAMLGVKVQLNKFDEVIHKLSGIPEVRFVASSTGRYDLFVEVITTTNKNLYDIIKNEFGKIDGIQSTETHMFIEIHKQSYDWGVGGE